MHFKKPGLTGLQHTNNTYWTRPWAGGKDLKYFFKGKPTARPLRLGDNGQNIY